MRIVQDFFDSNNPSNNYLNNTLLNNESGILLAIACRELKEYKKAIAALEHIMRTKPNYLPAIKHLVYIYELLEDYEKAKDVLIKSRTQVSSDEWIQDKLRAYDLI